MPAYATLAELRARVSGVYDSSADLADDDIATTFIEKASELIDSETLNRSIAVWSAGTTAQKAVVTQATCDQVEFWLEVGEEHDVAGATGSLVAGRVQMHPVSPVLAPRARRTLQVGGLLWRGVGAR